MREIGRNPREGSSLEFRTQGISESRVLKSTVRSALRSARRRLSPWVVEQTFGYAVAQRAANEMRHDSVDGVVLYLAAENEVPTGPLICKALSLGLPVFLPAFAGNEWTIARWWPGLPLRRGKFGLWEPIFGSLGDEETGRLLVYVPVVAWSDTGARVGRGAGAYDQLLARLGKHSTVTKVGLAYEFQRVALLPCDEGDVPLDFIATEKRMVACARGNLNRERSTQSWKSIF